MIVFSTVVDSCCQYEKVFDIFSIMFRRMLLIDQNLKQLYYPKIFLIQVKSNVVQYFLHTL